MKQGMLFFSELRRKEFSILDEQDQTYLDFTGGNIILNFFDPEDEKHGFEEIEAMANREKISIRSGCFCNPGIDEINNCLTTEEISRYFTSR
jgi:hypothetical protein